MARAQRWLLENEEALQSSNVFVEQHGLPLAPIPNATTHAAIAADKEGKGADVDIDEV